MPAGRVLVSALAASIGVVVLTACGGVESASKTSTPTTTTTGTPARHELRDSTNAPWYPSLQAFEHYDSGRSHVFSMARFGGSLHGPNTVDLVSSRKGAYPSGYNMSYLNAKDAFIQGGSYGDVKGSIGPFVAKVDPKTLKPVWYTQLVNTRKTREWDYPGAMAIMNDRFIYVVSGYRVFKVRSGERESREDPQAADAGLHADQLPPPNTPPTYASTPTEDARNTSYNGINALPDGTIVVKSLYRVAGCTRNGPTALLNCPNAQNVPASVLVSVNPKTMKIIDKITLPAFAGARPTITRYHGVDYVYLLEKTSNAVRYAVHNGRFRLDKRWTPAAVPPSYAEPDDRRLVDHHEQLGPRRDELHSCCRGA